MIGPISGRVACIGNVRFTLAVLSIVLAVTGCGANDLIPPPPADQSGLFWDLELNHHAVTLSTHAPYDTLTLVATPRNVERRPLMGLPAAQYESTDKEHVVVTPDGVLIAVAPASERVLVRATLTTGNLKHTDEVWVRVLDMDSVPVLAELSIHPVPPDSAKIGSVGSSGFGSCGHLPLFMSDVNGVSLVEKGMPVSVRSSDTTVAVIEGTLHFLNGSNDPVACDVDGKRPGTARLYATTTVFGVMKADTVDYRIGWPTVGAVHVVPAGAGRPGNVFVERELTLGVGSVVVWGSTALKDTAEVVFDDVTNVLSPHERPNILDVPGFIPQYLLFVCNLFGSDCNGGNPVLAPQLFFAAFRVFPVAGTYEFRDPDSGDRARIVIVDER